VLAVLAATRERGRDRLRLDCDATNAALRAYYENAGFLYRGDVEIPLNAALSGGRAVVSRYERPPG
jgi:RimJ/RimL family protein N-acetyltransferase